MSLATQLDYSIKQVCPIDGVSIGDPNNKNTWRIDFKQEATQNQKDSAQLVLTNFVYDPQTEIPGQTKSVLLSRMTDAIAANDQKTVNE